MGTWTRDSTTSRLIRTRPAEEFTFHPQSGPRLNIKVDIDQLVQMVRADPAVTLEEGDKIMLAISVDLNRDSNSPVVVTAGGEIMNHQGEIRPWTYWTQTV